MPVEEYPNLPEVGGVRGAVFPAKAFLKRQPKSAWPASRDGRHPGYHWRVVNGVPLRFSFFMATDPLRVESKRFHGKGMSSRTEGMQALVPARRFAKSAKPFA